MLEWRYVFTNGDVCLIEVRDHLRWYVLTDASGEIRQSGELSFTWDPIPMPNAVVAVARNEHVIEISPKGASVKEAVSAWKGDPILGYLIENYGRHSDIAAHPALSISRLGNRLDETKLQVFHLDQRDELESWRLVKRGVVTDNRYVDQIWYLFESTYGICFRSIDLNDGPIEVKEAAQLNERYYCGYRPDQDGDIVFCGAGAWRVSVLIPQILCDGHLEGVKDQPAVLISEHPCPHTVVRSSGDLLPRRVIASVYGGFDRPLRPIARADFKALDTDLVYAHVSGGGESVTYLNGVSPKDMLPRSVDDLSKLVKFLAFEKDQEVFLTGSSQGGLVALIVAMRAPQLVKKVSVISPVVDLLSYLESPLGQQFRSFYPSNLESSSPINLLNLVGGKLPDLQLIVPERDLNLGEQNYASFIEMWRKSGACVDLIIHEGDHFGPSQADLSRINLRQLEFLK